MKNQGTDDYLLTLIKPKHLILLTFTPFSAIIIARILNALRKQLSYVKMDLRYLEQFMSEGYAMTGKDINLYLTIIRLYEQQQYMYDNRVHSVEHRIVSISQPL